MAKIKFTINLDSTNAMQLKTRKTWDFNPASRSFKSVRDYNRRNTRAIERAARMNLD